MLVLSHVRPFPRDTGQRQRVFYTLRTAREAFHLTFATTVNGDAREVRERLRGECDDMILMPSLRETSRAAKAWHKAAGGLYALRTGLKRSNYAIGRLEFSPPRAATLVEGRQFDCVLFEYWHAAASVAPFRARGIPCVLDMHNILWHSYAEKLKHLKYAPGWLKRRALRNYKACEEAAWGKFDAVIAINREEHRYVSGRVPPATEVFYGPMGTDITAWPYSWRPSAPPRLAFYGGMTHPANQRGAMQCFREVMPRVWQSFPEAEFWIVGGSPPESIRALAAADPRVRVTGFVESPREVLGTMTAVLCPWSGTFGFRSRVVEVMALGVPVVATPDAVHGMEIAEGEGLLLGRGSEDLAARALSLLEDGGFARTQSLLARRQVEAGFTVAGTYGRLVRDLGEWLRGRRKGA
jgi:glycosyltransferase involved in cell wall biosynthesis